ncbi:hypothetical protein C0Q70_15149 [Pomacea canaliculata]|uniref:protein-tyrosine-phosphatase n=1 Tax=Pomacea canaliculata TaxID=400727 RepID=A0A2T7NU31_POMCA|nr:hypothetical protein C0Q70_15149 [Pomacea canaliculata]
MGASSLGSQNQKEDKTPVTARKSLAITETTVNKTIYENLELKSNVPIHSHDSQSAMSLTKPDKEDMDTANNVDEEEGIYNTEETYALYRSLGSSSIFDDLQKSLLDSLTSGKLEMEFAEFSKEMRHPHEAGRKTENLKKNRFKALCAYDHSRVVLRRPKGDRNTDYINASYIKGYLGEKAYIATQGPRSHTVDDLWWMVWQENVTQIIMLTSIKEDGKDKCEEYWPSAGTTTTYGHVSVTALKTDSRADFVVRYFVLESKQDGDQRTVSQYHYLVWPDHGVPSTYSLVSFWRYVKARAQGAIPVVHCRGLKMRDSKNKFILNCVSSKLRMRGATVIVGVYNVKVIVVRGAEVETSNATDLMSAKPILGVVKDVKTSVLKVANLETSPATEKLVSVESAKPILGVVKDVKTSVPKVANLEMSHATEKLVSVENLMTVEVKETSDCSPLILVAGYVVGFLIISLFIFAAKVIPYKKKSKPKAVKKEAEGDKEEEKTEGEGSGSGGDKVEELEAEGDKVEQEAEAEGEVQNEANSEIEERETQTVEEQKLDKLTIS